MLPELLHLQPKPLLLLTGLTKSQMEVHPA